MAYRLRKGLVLGLGAAGQTGQHTRLQLERHRCACPKAAATSSVRVSATFLRCGSPRKSEPPRKSDFLNTRPTMAVEKRAPAVECRYPVEGSPFFGRCSRKRVVLVLILVPFCQFSIDPARSTSAMTEKADATSAPAPRSARGKEDESLFDQFR